MANIFISYQHDDAEIAQVLVARLRGWGFSVFIDTHIRGGAEWEKTLEDELQAADAVVVLWSGNSVKSPYVRNEAQYGAKHGKLCPVVIADCEVPPLLQHIQWIDLRPFADSVSSPKSNQLREAIQHYVDRKGPAPDEIHISVRDTYCPTGKPVRSLAFFANDTELLMAYQHDFYGVELGTKRVYRGVNTHAGRPSLAISGDRAWILQSSSEGQETLFRTHDLSDASETRSLEARIIANALSYRGDIAATAVEDEVTVHDPRADKIRSVLNGHQADVISLAFSNDGIFIVSGSLDGTVKQWHVDSGACWRTFADGPAGVNWVGLTSDSKRVVAASQDGFVRTWNAETGELLNKARSHEEELLEATLLLDGQYVLGCYKSGQIVIWRTADGKRTASFDLKDYPTAIAVTEGCGLVAVAHGLGMVSVLELRFGADIDEARKPARLWS